VPIFCRFLQEQKMFTP